MRALALVRRVLGGSLLFVGGACGGPGATGRALVELEGPIDQMPPVGALRLRSAVQLDPADIWLLSGELTPSLAEGLFHGNPSSTLVRRRIEVAVFQKEGSLAVWPRRVLDPGMTYSIFAIGEGFLGAFRVARAPLAIAQRQGSADAVVGSWVPYCSATPHGLEVIDDGASIRVPLLYGGTADLRPGLGAHRVLEGRCFELRSTASAFWTPPAEVGEVFVEPEILRSLEGPSLELCSSMLEMDEASRLAPCMRVRGGVVEGPPDLDWAATRVLRGEEVIAETVTSGAFRFGPLESGSTYRIEFVFSSSRGRSEGAQEVEIVASEGRVVLNEIYSNPRGPEPQSEWVEVLNIGNAPISMAEFFLMDSGATVALPDVVLPPGGFGLIVPSNFQVSEGLDPLPDAGALPIVVERLGHLGLANAGEALELCGRGGEVISSVPKLTTREGRSLARLDPFGPDTVDAFAFHGAPGASPGRPNVFEP